MFSTTTLLVLACACAVSVYADCTLTEIGVETRASVRLPSVKLHDAADNVKIPYVAECGDKGVAGVKADVCDHVAPTAYFTDFNNLFVQRNGPPSGSAKVTVTVYCKT